SCNTYKICPLYGKSRLDNHSNHRITKGLIMRHVEDEHMMVYSYINDDGTNQIEQNELKMELDFIERLLRKTKHQLYKRLEHLQRHRAIKVLFH
ncbi:unnamed protein product, partial [Rotaria magnacalcarata]